MKSYSTDVHEKCGQRFMYRTSDCAVLLTSQTPIAAQGAIFGPSFGEGVALSPTCIIGVCICVYIYMYICMYIYTHTYVQVRILAYTYTDVHMYIHIYAHSVHVDIYIYIYGSPPHIDPYFWASTTYSGRHLMRNQVFGFRDTLPPSAMPGGGPP